MGILNITPDSFSDGGKYSTIEAAIGKALDMERNGASIIDIGGESTRPGASPVSITEEKKRIIPILQALRQKSDILISIDTRKPEVAKEALIKGADIINDIEGLGNHEMIDTCSRYGCGIIITHMQGTPENMQRNPTYNNVVQDVRLFFEEKYCCLLAKGIKKEQICWDPGIGFGKTLEHNLQLIAHLDELRIGERPIMLALSRKAFMSQILNSQKQGRSPLSTAVMTTYGHMNGAQLHRVHDVEECAQALKLLKATQEHE